MEGNSGDGPEKRVMAIQEMLDKATEAGDYHGAVKIHNRFQAEFGEGKLAGLGGRTKLLAQEYNRLAGLKALELDKAEIAGDRQAVQRLSREYASYAEKGMDLTAADYGYGRESGRAQRMRQERASKGTLTDEALLKAARNDILTADLYDRVIRARSEAERQAIVGSAYDVKLMDKVHEAWIMGMLSNPLTWTVNLSSNAAKIPLRWASESAGAVADAVISGVRGTPRTKTLRDVKARMRGARAAVPEVMDGMRDLLVWRTYINDLHSPLASNAKIEMYGPKIGGQLGASKAEIAAGSLTRIPGKVLQAGDNIFRTIAEFEEAFSMASERSGKAASANDISRLAKDLLKDPEKAEADLLRIKAAGDRAVFTDPLAEQKGFLPMVGRGLQKAKAGEFDKMTRTAKWGARVIVPFSRTPTNIIIDALRHSPFGSIELYRMIRDGAGQRGNLFPTRLNGGWLRTHGDRCLLGRPGTSYWWWPL